MTNAISSIPRSLGQIHLIFIGLLWLCCTSAIAQIEPQLKVDLSSSVKIAEERSPDFDSLKRNLKVAELEKENADKHWMPQIDLTAAHGILDRDPKLGSEPWASSMDLSLSGNIYDNGESNLKRKIYSQKLTLAQQTFLLERDKLVLNLAIEFLRFSLFQKTLELQETQLALIKKQFQTASNEYFQGLKTQRDHLRFKTQVSRGEIDVLTSRNNVLKSKQELLRMMGHAPTESRLDFVPLPLLTDRPLLDSALDPKDSLKFGTIELQKSIEEQNLELAQKTLYPILKLSTGASYSSSNYLGTNSSFTENDGVSWNIQLTLNFKLFDGGILNRKHQVDIEKAQIAKNGLDTQLLNLTNELQQWNFQRQQALANLKLARELQTLEKKNRELIEMDYRNGRAYFLDFITTLSNELDAQYKFFNAIHDSENLRYALLAYKGKLFETLLSKGN